MIHTECESCIADSSLCGGLTQLSLEPEPPPKPSPARPVAARCGLRSLRSLQSLHSPHRIDRARSRVAPLPVRVSRRSRWSRLALALWKSARTALTSLPPGRPVRHRRGSPGFRPPVSACADGGGERWRVAAVDDARGTVPNGVRGRGWGGLRCGGWDERGRRRRGRRAM